MQISVFHCTTKLSLSFRDIFEIASNRKCRRRVYYKSRGSKASTGKKFCLHGDPQRESFSSSLNSRPRRRVCVCEREYLFSVFVPLCGMFSSSELLLSWGTRYTFSPFSYEYYSPREPLVFPGGAAHSSLGK